MPPTGSSRVERGAMSARQPETVPSGDRARRPYDPPRILFREPLEAMASICSPAPPAKHNVAACHTGPISS
jgi:hypothetical protein